MKKIGKKHLKIYDAVFKQEVHVFINTPHEEYNRWLKRVGCDEEERENHNFLAYTTTLESDTAPNMYVVYLPDFQWTIRQQATLVHELAHVIVRIWDTNNIKFNVDTQEFYAHTLGRLYEDIAKKLL